MAGHSQFKNIMHRKGAQDAKRAKLFTKLGRELTVAAREGGDDPTANPRLRAAIAMARSHNMPKDNIDRSIKKGVGGDTGNNYEAIRYEGYGPMGVAIIVEALTDNRNRTASDVRSTLTKYGGNLGETGSVAFLFDQVGHLRFEGGGFSEEELLEKAIEAGADDVVSDDQGHDVYCQREVFNDVRDLLHKHLGDPISAALLWRPHTTVAVQDVDKARTILKLMEALEDNDDVQQVYANFDLADDLLAHVTN